MTQSSTWLQPGAHLLCARFWCLKTLWHLLIDWHADSLGLEKRVVDTGSLDWPGWDVAPESRWGLLCWIKCHCSDPLPRFPGCLLEPNLECKLQKITWLESNYKRSCGLNPPIEAMSCDNLDSIGGFKSCDLLQFCIPILAQASNLKNTLRCTWLRGLMYTSLYIGLLNQILSLRTVCVSDPLLLLSGPLTQIQLVVLLMVCQF